MIHFTILTLFPTMFPGPLAQSVIGRAMGKYWDCDTIDLRQFAGNKHQRVDDSPFGGGAGMVIRAEVVYQAVEFALANKGGSPVIIHPSPRGQLLTAGMAKKLSQIKNIIFICGHYEAIDQRFFEHHQTTHPDIPLLEISIGDYILSGGELPAMVMMEAVLRYQKGVVGKESSIAEESHEQGLLEHHHYTRPEEWRGLGVPKPLLTGNHKKIKEWRDEQALAITKERRPDLLNNKECKDKKN